MKTIVLITILILGIVFLIITRTRYKNLSLEIKLNQHTLCIAILITILSFTLNMYFIGLLWIIISYLQYKNFIVLRDTKQVLRQAYEYHGSQDFIKMMNQQYGFIGKRYNLNKLKNDFDKSSTNIDNN